MDPTGLRVTVPSGQVTLTAERNHVVGRGRDCDVVIVDGRVSRRHIVLEPRGDDGWVVRDISSNGMWTRGARTSSVAVSDGEVRVNLGAVDGPLVILAYTRPAPRPGPATGPQARAGTGSDIGDQETMLAGQGRPAVPVPPAPPVPPSTPRHRSRPVPAGGTANLVPGPQPPGQYAPTPVPPQPGRPDVPEPVGAAAGAHSGSGPATRSPGAVWLRALPTFVWLAALGFALGALLALS